MKTRSIILFIIITVIFVIMLLFLQTILSCKFMFNKLPDNFLSNMKLTLNLISLIPEGSDINNVIDSIPFSKQIKEFEYYYFILFALIIIFSVLFFLLAGFKQGLKWNSISFLVSGILMIILIVFKWIFFSKQILGANLHNALQSGGINAGIPPEELFAPFLNTIRNIGILFIGIGIILIAFLFILRHLEKKKPKKLKKQQKDGNKKRSSERKKLKTTRKKPLKKIENEQIKIPFKAYSGKKSYIVLSYVHKDMKVVFNIIDKLHKKGYRIWYDEGIELGDKWAETIGKKIVHCNQLLICISPKSICSRNVRNEIDLAIRENKDMLVVYLEETRLSSGLKLQIGSVQHINKFEVKQDMFFNKLCSVLKK